MRHRGSLRTTAGWTPWLGGAAAVAAVALLVASSALPGPLSGLGPHAAAARASARRAGSGPEGSPGLTDLLKARLDPRTFQLIGPLLQGGAGPDGPEGRQASAPPPSLDRVLGLAGADGIERLPVPDAAGPEPLLGALQGYLAATGATVPPHDALRAAVAALHLDGVQESALAQLVLAYTEALQLQAQATRDLTPPQRLLLQGERQATLDWFAANPGAGAADLQSALAALARDHVDQGLLLQAGDLLARTVEAVRIPLGQAAASDASRPDAADPSPPPPSGGDAAAQGPWQALRTDLAGLLAQPTPPTAAAPAPSLTLEQALHGVLQGYGLESALPGPVSLPGSLDGALAELVAAQAQNVSARDGRPHVDGMLDAAERAEPTLRAWAALLQDPAAPAQADRAAVLASLLGPDPSPGTVSAAAQARPASQVGPPPALAPLLESAGLGQGDADRVAGSLPLPVAGALAYELAAQATLAQAHAALVAALPEAQREALLATPSVAGLLALDPWTPAQADQVRTWAEALAALDSSRLSDLRQAQADAVAATQAAASLLQTPASLPAPPAPAAAGPGGLPLSQASAADVGCPADSPFSDCQDDVLLALDVAGGILVTGTGSSRLDSMPGGQVPQITIDLGGDDEFGFPAGAAQVGLDGAPAPQFLGVHIDVAGNDTYRSAAPVAQGAALGLGTVGILWDLSGDDHYLLGPSAAAARYAQGFGGDGGLGVLVDASGSDEHAAPGAMAQGAGMAPSLQVSAPGGTDALPSLGDELGGTGLLLDLGAGADRFHAAAGQGHSEGHATVGVLFDQQGASAYDVSSADLASQGGRGAASSGAVQPAQGRDGGLALLLDLGGAGDSYTSPPFASSGLDPAHGTLVLRTPPGAPRKQDDTLWLDWTRGAALGIDSTLADEDGDLAPNLVELLAGSDPKDAADTPAQGALRAPSGAGGEVARILALATDSDGDGFPDYVEAQLGSDPGDPGSTPLPVPEPTTSVLLDLPILCPASNATACDGAAACPPAMGDQCVSLLTVGGPASTTYRHPALLQVDLAGDDRYLAPVAASTSFWLPQAARTATHGGVSIDLLGNDHYGSPDAKATQAYANGDADLLLDLSGNDTYEAAASAQASAADGGVALLADFAGKDVYRAGPQSQAYVTFKAGSTGQASAGSWAALVDLAGDDSYRFATQALVAGKPQTIGAQATALLLDAGGRDTYNSTAVPADPAGPSAAFPATLFETQGGVDLLPGGAIQATAAGVFADLGPEPDTYLTLDPSGGVADVSAQKDGAGVVANPVDAPVSGARSPATTPAYATALFIDGGSPSQDSDGDRWPDLAEALAGTDPHDAHDSPATADPGAPTVAHLAPDGAVLGTLGSLGTLRLPGLVVGGTGPDTYRDDVPFLVDLGGNDAYLSPAAGGTFASADGVGTGGVQAGSVALLLDLGAGDDTYHPADCVVDAPPADGDVATRQSYAVTGDPDNAALTGAGADAFTTCPSLGGAADGVAVLADDGGRNDFRSRTWVNASVASDSDRHLQAMAWGGTQGSSLFAGVGILATWDATNRFAAEVHVKAAETDPDPEPAATAIGLAQGAAWGSGTGILASFGQGDDDYSVATSARADRLHGVDGGVAQDVAQGAAVGGQGILVDEGGRNTFHAPSGRAQGFATPFQLASTVTVSTTASVDPRPASQAMGVLWSGPGDDTYDAGDASQGSAGLASTTVQNQATVRSLGLLADLGGNDRYEIAPAAGADRVGQRACAPPRPLDCAASQGAGLNQGTGVLLDLAGDDRYEAPGRSYVQGAAAGADANGLHVDLGGNDVRRAASAAQAFAETGGHAVLADLSGRDGYVLQAMGQGFAQTGGTAVFLDTGGDDRYDYGGQKVANTAVLSAPPDHGNDWMWTSPGASTTTEVDADVETLQQALDILAGAGGPTPPDGGAVTLTVARQADGGGPVADGDTAGGSLYLFATVTPDSGFRAQRVDVLLDGMTLGPADPLGPAAGGRQVFRLAWDTRGAPSDPARVAVPDGPHDLAATAFFQPAQEAPPPADGASPVGQPDVLAVESGDTTVVVDNPPVAAGGLASDALGAIGRNALSPALGQTATLTVRVSRDAAFPASATPPPGSLPGATLAVVLRDVTPTRPPTSHLVAELYAYNGTATQVTLDGHCPDESGRPACPDGAYLVNATLTDARGQPAWLPESPLLIDGTAPRSAVQMPVLPDWAGLGFKVGFSGLGVHWTSDDDALGLGAGNVAGIGGPLGSVTVLRLDASGHVLDSQRFGGAATSYPFQTPPIGTGDVVRILTVATDALGNQESPCLDANEAAPCFLGKAATPGAIADVGIDYSPPELRDLRIVPQADVRPDTDVTVSANASEEAPGLAVQLRLSGVSVAGVADPTLTMARGADDQYTATVRFDTPPTPRETPFAFTVTAADRAHNSDARSGIGFLDTKAPTLADLAVAYVSNGTAAALGRPGSEAFVSVNATDHEVAAVTLHAPPFGDASELPCTRDVGARWQCEVPIPGNASNGDYPFAVNATDAAGNRQSLAGVLTVAGQPPRILDATASATGPESVRVRWNTTVPATSQVRFGTIFNRLDQQGPVDCVRLAANGQDCAEPRLATRHDVNVTGLRPGTTYYLQPIPSSAANVVNATGPLLNATTGSGYLLTIQPIPAEASWGGRRDVTVGVDPVAGVGPVKVSASLRDAQNQTEEVDSFTGPGPHVVSIDTRGFPDGLYALVLDGQRQADRQRVVSTPFRLDNTPPVLVAGSPRPGLTSGTAKPDVVLAVTDPFNPDLPPLESLDTLIDGSPFVPVAPGYRSQGAQQRLTFTLPAALPSGDHRLTVRLTDAAGNVGETTWSFGTDARSPALQGAPRVTYVPGPAAAAPGGRVLVGLNATDPAGVAGVAIDLKPIHGGSAGLFAVGGLAWNGSFQVPADAPAGRVSLPIVATDGLGNAGPIGALEVVVDRDAPAFVSTKVDLVNLTAARLAVATDEPTTLGAQVAGQPQLQDAQWSTQHALVLSGLRPGTVNNVTLVAHDGAGHATPLAIVVKPAADDEPPSAPGAAAAASLAEGRVELSWQPASDNAGVSHYEAVRLAGDERTALPATNGTRLSDDGAPPGRNVTYEVSAVDVVGQRGPAARVQVHVLALPHLSNASITPASGPSDRPFRVEVTYAQPAGVAPETIALRYGDLTFTLHRTDAGTDCQAGCAYAGDVLLPPLSVLHAPPQASILAKADGQSAQLPVAAPLVSAGGALGIQVGARPAPALGTLLALAAVAVGAAARRRRDA